MSTTTEEPRISYRDMRSKVQELIDEDLKEQILEGIDKLNEVYGPDWVNRVDAMRLIMADGTRCVIGQLERSENEHASFWDGLKKVGLDSAHDNAFYRVGGEGYRRLDKAWKTILGRED